jgi:RNA recognition motif-containing protein
VDPMARILIKHLPYDATDHELRTFVEDVGEVLSVDLRRDPLTGHAKSIATIEVASPAEAHDLVERLNHRELRGHRLVVAHADMGKLASDEPLVEVPGRQRPDDAPAAQPHRPVREQGRNPARWGH